MKRFILLVWLLLLWVPILVHAQVYEMSSGVSGDCRPVITGTANGVSVWTEFGPDTAPCFFVDLRTGVTVAKGIQASKGAVSGSPLYETVGGLPMIRLGTGTSEYAYWPLPVSPVGGSMFAESLGAECVNDGGFDTACGAGTWTCQSGWAIGGSSAYYTDSIDNAYLKETLSKEVVKDHLYKVTFTIVSSGSAVFSITNDAGTGLFLGFPNSCPNGSYTYYFKARSTTSVIRIYGNTTSTAAFTVDSISVKDVSNTHSDTISTPLPPHGTTIIDFRPGYNASDMTGITQPVLDLSGDTIFQVYASGVTCFDGTTGATVAYAPVMDKTTRFIAEWGYLVNNVSKMRAGIIQNNQPISWGIEQNFDGAFSVGSQLRVLTSPWGRAHAGQWAIFPRIVSDAELNMMGSP